MGLQLRPSRLRLHAERGDLLLQRRHLRDNKPLPLTCGLTRFLPCFPRSFFLTWTMSPRVQGSCWESLGVSPSCAGCPLSMLLFCVPTANA